MGINLLGKQNALLLLSQVIGLSFNRHLVHLCSTHQAFTLLPPEILAALDIAWNEKDGDRHLQLTCKHESMSIVIMIAVVKSQYQGGTRILRRYPFLLLPVKFLKRFFKMQHAVVTAQVEEMAMQVSSACMMIGQNNQPLP